MRRFAEKATVTMLGLALATVPLTGCFGGGDGKTDETVDDVTAPADDVSEPESEVRTPTGNPDYTTWVTLGDAFATAVEDPAYSCDEHYYTTIVNTGEQSVYVVAQMTPDKLNAIQSEDVDTAAKTEEALADLPIAFKEAIPNKTIPQAVLDGFVGKTGQDLVNEGYVFESYYLYGGPETGASFANGYYAYEVQFAITTPEETVESDDGGASLLGATITSITGENKNFNNLVFDSMHIAETTHGALPNAVADDVADATDVATDGAADTMTDAPDSVVTPPVPEPVAVAAVDGGEAQDQ